MLVSLQVRFSIKLKILRLLTLLIAETYRRLDSVVAVHFFIPSHPQLLLSFFVDAGDLLLISLSYSFFTVLAVVILLLKKKIENFRLDLDLANVNDFQLAQVHHLQSVQTDHQVIQFRGFGRSFRCDRLRYRVVSEQKDLTPNELSKALQRLH